MMMTSVQENKMDHSTVFLQKVAHQFNTIALNQMKLHGQHVLERQKTTNYINVSKIIDLCNKNNSKNKYFSAFLQRKKTKRLMLELEANTLEERKKLRRFNEHILPLIVKEDKKIYVQPSLVPSLWEWLNNAESPNQLEAQITHQYHKELGGKREVSCRGGLIDLLTSKEIIEVKHIKKWKQAMGQLLVYSEDFPKKQKKLILFTSSTKNNLDKEKKKFIFQTCAKFDIKVDIVEF